MKIKYFFALILVLTVMFSLGTIAAGEDIDFNASSLEDTYLSSGGAEIPISDNDCEDIQSSSNEDIEMNSSADDADLYVDMELGDTEKTTYGINNITFDVPLIVTAKALEGNVKNAKVYINIPGEFKYLSFNKTAGEYDPESGYRPALIACFDENIPDSVIKAIAKRQPLRAVFRDSSFKDSPSKINVGEIFKMLAPDTRVKVI